LKCLSSKTIAWTVHDELLMMFAVMHVWHPGLIRSCQANGPAPNVFRREGQIDRPGLALTPAAKRAHKHDLGVWQFDFEIERGVGAFGVIIDAVAPLLDEYMTKHRRNSSQEKKIPEHSSFPVVKRHSVNTHSTI
jgi:hypothetical protein